jgi:hypothetical protein
MDLLAELTALVGQRVTIHQEHLEPPVVVGILVAPADRFFIVDDEDGEGEASFSWTDVATVNGHMIILETPASLNEGWDDSDLGRSDADLEDEEGW